MTHCVTIIEEEPLPLKQHKNIINHNSDVKSNPIYKVHAQIGTNPRLMHVRILAVDTCAGPSLVRPDLIPEDCRHLIEPCRNLVIRSATIHSQPIKEMIRLNVRIGDLTVPWYFRVSPDLPPGILVCTAFSDEHIDNIQPRVRQIKPRASKPVPILALSLIHI